MAVKEKNVLLTQGLTWRVLNIVAVEVFSYAYFL